MYKKYHKMARFSLAICQSNSILYVMYRRKKTIKVVIHENSTYIVLTTIQVNYITLIGVWKLADIATTLCRLATSQTHPTLHKY